MANNDNSLRVNIINYIWDDKREDNTRLKHKNLPVITRCATPLFAISEICLYWAGITLKMNDSIVIHQCCQGNIWVESAWQRPVWCSPATTAHHQTWGLLAFSVLRNSWCGFARWWEQRRSRQQRTWRPPAPGQPQTPFPLKKAAPCSAVCFELPSFVSQPMRGICTLVEPTQAGRLTGLTDDYTVLSLVFVALVMDLL